MTHHELARELRTIVLTAPLFGGFIIAIAGAIWSGIQAIGTFIATSLSAVVSWIVDTALPAILTTLTTLGSLVAKGFGYFLKGLRHVLSDIVHGRFVHLWRDYLNLKNVLNNWFTAHFGWLIKLRNVYSNWYKTTIQPVLDVINHVRGVLKIFRLFHLKFAERLDNYLGKLESKIIHNSLVLRQKINEILDYVDLVLDPAGLVRRNIFLGSAAGALRGLFNSLGLGFGRKLSTAEQRDGARERHRLTRAGMRDDADSHPESGLSAELLGDADSIERALPPLEGDKASRFT